MKLVATIKVLVGESWLELTKVVKLHNHETKRGELLIEIISNFAWDLENEAFCNHTTSLRFPIKIYILHP